MYKYIPRESDKDLTQLPEICIIQRGHGAHAPLCKLALIYI